MLQHILLAILLAITCISKSQDDPCKFIQHENKMDSCSAANTNLVIDLHKPWKRKYSNEWQLLCFTPEQMLETLNPTFTCQLNSNISESFKRIRKSTLIEIAISDETQILWIPDSILIFSRDLTRVKAAISKKSNNKVLSPLMNLTLQTQKFNKFESSIDSLGRTVKLLESGFLSPGTLIIQSGIKLSLNSVNEIDFGIASAKYQWISNKKLRLPNKQYDKEVIKEISKPQIDGGLAANGTFESTFNKTVKIEQSISCFYPLTKPRNPELEMRNKFSIKLSKHLRTSFQTVYSYSESRWPPSFWRAELRLGYLVDN